MSNAAHGSHRGRSMAVPGEGGWAITTPSMHRRAGPSCAGSEFAPVHARAGRRYRDVDPAARTELHEGARENWRLLQALTGSMAPRLVSAKSLKGNWLWREDSNLRPPD